MFYLTTHTTLLKLKPQEKTLTNTKKSPEAYTTYNIGHLNAISITLTYIFA